MAKTALITGITGQDGSYLAEFLLDKGYEVHGITRSASSSNTSRIDRLISKKNIHLHDGDMTEGVSLMHIISETKPDEPNNVSKLDAHVCWLLGDEVDKDAYVALLSRAHVHVKPYVDGTCKIEDWV